MLKQVRLFISLNNPQFYTNKGIQKWIPCSYIRKESRLLHILEGNNGSGKTTYFNRRFASNKRMLTGWLNPKRWPEFGFKSDFSDLPGDIDNYLFGAYETIYQLFKEKYLDIFQEWWWDRSFISAWVYGSLTNSSFKELSILYSRLDCNIYYIDTPWEICKERCTKMPYKVMEDKRELFMKALDICSEHNIEIHILKNVQIKEI